LVEEPRAVRPAAGPGLLWLSAPSPTLLQAAARIDASVRDRQRAGFPTVGSRQQQAPCVLVPVSDDPCGGTCRADMAVTSSSDGQVPAGRGRRHVDRGPDHGKRPPGGGTWAVSGAQGCIEG